MQYIQGIRDFSLDRPSAVTLGKFDGVHMGHQKLIEMIQEKAKQENLLSVVFTFDKIPLRLCPQKNQHFITTNTERRMFLEKQGVDVEIEYPFTEDFMNMEPEAFIEEILIGRLHAKYVVVGTDYHFGKGRMGNAQMLWNADRNMGLKPRLSKKSGIRSGKSVVHMSVKSCASDTWKLSMCCLADPTASMVLYQRESSWAVS